MSDGFTGVLTPKKLERLGAVLRAAGYERSVQPILRRKDRQRAPLSYAQQRLWFLDQLQPGLSVYNLPTVLRLEGALDHSFLQRCLNDMMRRHEILRTRFELGVGGQPEQVVVSDLTLQLPVVEIPGRSWKEKNAEVRRLAEAEAQRPFDLKTGPLLRAQLLRLDHDEHVILLTVHHIISDGWSEAILVREIGQLHHAYASGADAKLPPLAIQYGDYTAWQREWLQGTVLEAQLEYWRKQLQGIKGVLELPTDRPRPAVQTYRGAHCQIRLERGLGGELEHFARAENATLYMVMLAALQVLLSRYAREEDIAVGSPIANRTREETENLIGFFVNTLVFRTVVSMEEGFRGLLGRVREVALGAYAHQDVPFEKLVDEFQTERDLSRAPLFQVMLALQNTPQQRLQLPGLKLTLLLAEAKAAKFDLLIGLEQRDGQVEGMIEYSTDLFDETTIIRMMGHWHELIWGMIREPQKAVGRIDWLSAAERQQIVREWNRTDRQYGPAETVMDRFEEQVRRTPENVAVVHEQIQLSYRALNQRANQMARYLRKKGVGCEQLVGICMERSLEMVVGLLGILKAGGAYVPLDPGYPGDRLRSMLKDAGAKWILVEESLPREIQKKLEEGEGKIIQVATVWEQWGEVIGESAEDLSAEVNGENLAYMIYTSGSTGQPKGAMNRHSGILNRLEWMQDAYRLGHQDRVLQKTPYSFDVSVWEFFWPLMTGARLVMARPGGHQDPNYLIQLIRHAGITTVHFVPSMLQAFVEEPGVEQCTSLHRVICSGEALSWNLQERFHECIPQAELYNLYGPTEAAVDVTSWKCERGSQGFGVPLGLPISNLQIHILDDCLEPVPVGVAGEIHIGGAGLGRGYWGRPALTAEKFIPDPFSSLGGGRLYKTGDLGRRRPNGVLEYLGRLDHQVKIRGFRIELGEIEAALVAHPGVREAVVVAQEEDRTRSKKLIGYVVLQNAGKEFSGDFLRERLREHLPEYMVPATIIELERMPLSLNGKLDRKALPKADVERKTPYVAPRTPDERLLVAIWSEVLRVERVGIDENFFNLGGDSILSIQVRVRAQVAGLEFSLQDLFRHSTIRQLVRCKVVAVREQPPETKPFSLIGEQDRRKVPDFIEDAYPLAMLQMGMLFHQEFAPPDAVMYHNVNSYHVRAAWDREKFLQAVQLVAARHPALRTSFDLQNFSVPLQLVHRNASFPVDEDDLRLLTNEQQEAALAAFMVSARRKRFDLSQPPQLRFHVHRRSDDRFQFTFTENHAIIDGWSLHATLAEVFENYFKLLAGQQVTPEPPPRSTYRDFIAMEQRDAEIEEHRRFWAGTLSDSTLVPLPELTLPAQRKQEARVRSREVQIDRELSAGLEQLAQTLSMPLKSVLLAAHMKAIAVATGSCNVTSGLVANGRLEVEDGEQVRGLFLNTIPFRLKLAGETWAELISMTFSAEHEMLPHRRYPLALIQRNSGTEDLFDSYFNFAHFHVIEGVLQSGNIEILGSDKYESTSFKLYAAFGAMAGYGVGLELQYDDSLITEEQIEAIVHYYLYIFKAMVADPQKRHGELCFLSPLERRQLLRWNETGRSYACEKILAEVIAEQAQKTPEAVAVTFEGRSLEYGELNRQAAQLAHYLRKIGVGPEELVGICMERSLEMMVGLLATLKAGAAYVPLDPGYPQERLWYMIEDAHIRVVLTQERLLKTLPVGGNEWVCVDRDWPLIAVETAEEVDHLATPDHLAYVIYTSGSTGKPKGVMVRQRSLTNFAKAMDDCLGHETPGRWLAVTSLSFDISILELIWPLTHGFQIILHSGDKVADCESVLDQITRYAVTHLQCTPSMMSMLLSNPRAPVVLKSLKKLMLGGEALPLAMAQRLREIVSCEIRNLYGPTETTIWSTTWPLPASMDTMTIGQPIANTQIHILDEQLNPVPIGATGEIHIGGEGVARGYVARPDLTAERFIPNIFAGQSGERIYRTGDLGRYRKDGTIEYLGRIDQQVKVRGHRIEMGEIEMVLASHEAVREAAVVVQQDESGGNRLAGYVTLKDSATSETPDGTQIKDYVRSKLPEYMVPAVIAILEHMPLTPNGKLDRKALPKPALESWGHRTGYVAPRDGVEEILAQIWAAVLDVERVGIHDNFFDLGGHSLSATQLIARMNHAFQMSISLRELFEQLTVERLALTIGDVLRGDRKEATSLKPIVPRRLEEKRRLSFAQQRLWFMDLFEPESASYNLPAAVMLEGELDVCALERSVNQVIRRHEILRTRFALNGEGEPEQVVMETLTLELPVLEVAGETERERRATVLRLAAEEARRSFDLKTGPLIRVRILRLGADRRVVLFTLHHIVSDDWSQGLLIEEVAALYTAYAQGKEPSLEPLPIQYGDYAVWQRDWLEGEALHRQLEYWRKQLGGMTTVLALPTDHPRPALQTYAGANYRFALEPEQVRKARGLARQESATLYMVLLAVFDLLLWRYSGQKDIAVGTPIANRTRVETEKLIGFFANTLVLRAQVIGPESFRELLSSVREITLGAYTHQDIPFEKLVEELNPGRDLSHSPLFQAMLALQNTPRRLPVMPGIRVQGIEAENLTAKFDLTMFLNEDSSGGLEGVIEYNTDLFDEATITRMAGHWLALTRSIATLSEKPVADLPFLSAGECYQIVHEWNQTQLECSPQATLVGLFEELAVKRPNHLAVAFKEESYSFAALNQRANQLAFFLRESGMGPEQLVGLCMERSLDMVVALLGILKAGGAYVPLDPTYPVERLKHMIEDSGAGLVLTQERLLTAIPDTLAKLVCLDRDWPQIASHRRENLAVSINRENLAYVIYTSGSTGKPKGVMVRHGSLENFAIGMDDCLGSHSPGTWLAVTSLSFDISVLELLWPLSRGFRVIIQAAGIAGEVDPVLDQIKRHDVSHLQCTPSMAWLLLLNPYAREVLRPLKKMLVGGENLPLHLGQQLKQIVSGQVINMYGPTETTIWSSSWILPDTMAAVAIGRPIANTQIYILDESLNPLPVGAAGELYIGGYGVARGYLNRAELTSERFIPDPFSHAGGERFYRTGDLARYRIDGTIEYLGRADQQIKLRGFRIELGEIEALLASHPMVHEAAVAVREDGAGDKQLVGYVVLRKAVEETEIPAPLDSAQFREYLRSKLPDYMVPAVIVELAEMPLTPNHKLDRRSLPNPESILRRREVDHVPARNDLESKLAEIWQKSLGVERVGMHDNFFDLGGHSLLLARIHAELRHVLGLEVSIVDLFRYPSIADLGDFLAHLSPTTPDLVIAEAAVEKLEAGKDRLKQLARRRMSTEQKALV